MLYGFCRPGCYREARGWPGVKSLKGELTQAHAYADGPEFADRIRWPGAGIMLFLQPLQLTHDLELKLARCNSEWMRWSSYDEMQLRRSWCLRSGSCSRE